MANRAAAGGKHYYIENCILTRSTIKVFMGVSLKLRFIPDFGKNMKNTTYLVTFLYNKNYKNAFFSKRARIFIL